MNITQSSPLLIDESPLQVLPSLAVATSLNEAIVLQQVHYWLKHNERDKKTTHYIDDRWWTYNTYENWQKENFPFWSARTVRRAFSDLEKRGILVSANHHRRRSDRTKWYTIDYAALNLLATSCGQNGQLINGSDWPDGEDKMATSSINTETSSRKYSQRIHTQTEETANAGVCVGENEFSFFDPSSGGDRSEQELRTPATDSQENLAAEIVEYANEQGWSLKVTKGLSKVAEGKSWDELRGALQAMCEQNESEEGLKHEQRYFTKAVEEGWVASEEWHDKKRWQRQQREEQQRRAKDTERIKTALGQMVANGDIELIEHSGQYYSYRLPGDVTAYNANAWDLPKGFSWAEDAA